MVYFFFYHEFKNKMKSKTNANQKQTYTHRKNSKQLISFQYSRKIAETDTLNAYTNNEKKTRFPQVVAVPAPHVTPVMLLLLETQ